MLIKVLKILVFFSFYLPSFGEDHNHCLMLKNQAIQLQKHQSQNLGLEVSEVSSESLKSQFHVSPSSNAEVAIVTIHGFGDPTFFQKEAYELSRYAGVNWYQVILPGHGQDIPQRKQRTYKDWENEVQQLIEMASQSAKKVVVVGFSLGGLLAFSQAIIPNSSIDGLVLVEPAFKIHNHVKALTCMGSWIIDDTSSLAPLAPPIWMYEQYFELIKRLAPNISEKTKTKKPNGPKLSARIVEAAQADFNLDLGCEVIKYQVELKRRYSTSCLSCVGLCADSNAINNTTFESLFPLVSIPTLAMYRHDDKVVDSSPVFDLAKIGPHVTLATTNQYGPSHGVFKKDIDEISTFITNYLPSQKSADFKRNIQAGNELKELEKLSKLVKSNWDTMIDFNADQNLVEQGRFAYDKSRDLAWDFSCDDFLVEKECNAIKDLAVPYLLEIASLYNKNIQREELPQSMREDYLQRDLKALKDIPTYQNDRKKIDELLQTAKKRLEQIVPYSISNEDLLEFDCNSL